MRESLLLEALRETNLNIDRALFVKLDNKWNFKSTGAAHTRLYFITKGSGFLKTDTQYIEMTEGNVYFIPANCSFSCGCEYMEKVFFHINISTMEKYDLFFGTDQIFSLSYPRERADDLKTLLISENYVDLIRIKNILLETIIEFCEKYSMSKGDIRIFSPLIQSLITYIDENTIINLTVADISKALFISESKIRNAFKQEMGMTIGRYIDDMVFIKAKRLLSNPENTIASVSSELGFCDQFYFSRRFKEKFNITPTRFKMQNKIG
jgi:AraC-like DNA-binding protein